MNMSDRLGAIGGTVRWESQPGHGAPSPARYLSSDPAGSSLTPAISR